MSHSKLFSGIEVTALDRMLSRFPQRKFKKREFILEQGEPCDEVFLVTKGRIEVLYTSSEKKPKVIAVQDAPVLCGMLEVWEKSANLANVRAVTECSALAMSQTQYLALLQMNHQFCINLIKLTSIMFCETGRNRRLDQFGKVEHLLANTLCTLADLDGVKKGQGLLIQKKINKSNIGRIIGVSRKSVIRAFDTLEAEKLIRVEADRVFINDLPALKKHAWAL